MAFSIGSFNLTRLLTVVGGGVILLTSLTAMTWIQQIGLFPSLVPGLMMELAEFLGGIVTLFLVIKWNENYADLYISVIIGVAGLSLAFSLHHMTNFYLAPFGLSILIGGLITSTGGVVGIVEYKKIPITGNYTSVDGEQEILREGVVRPEFLAQVKRSKKDVRENGVRICANCGAVLPEDAAFCIGCGASQEED